MNPPHHLVHGAEHLPALRSHDQHLAGLLMITACPLSYLIAAVIITVQLIGRPQTSVAVRVPSQPFRRPLAVRTISRRRLKRIIGFVLFGLAAIVLGGFLLAWSGLYNVAASRGHWPVTNEILTFGMRNSVKTHALGIEAPPLDSNDLSTLGAAHFHSGCAFCHGAPGVPISPIAAKHAACRHRTFATSMRDWRDRELFWIVKNGLKYTGMPAWVAAAAGR